MERAYKLSQQQQCNHSCEVWLLICSKARGLRFGQLPRTRQNYLLLLCLSGRLTVALLIPPVGSDSILSNEVHLASADLDLHWPPIRQSYDCV